MESTYQASHAGATFHRNAQNILGKRSNVLLVRDDVGRAKPTTRNLPKEDFAFGKGNRFDESAGDGK